MFNKLACLCLLKNPEVISAHVQNLGCKLVVCKSIKQLLAVLQVLCCLAHR